MQSDEVDRLQMSKLITEVWLFLRYQFSSFTTSRLFLSMSGIHKGAGDVVTCYSWVHRWSTDIQRGLFWQEFQGCITQLSRAALWPEAADITNIWQVFRSPDMGEQQCKMQNMWPRYHLINQRPFPNISQKFNLHTVLYIHTVNLHTNKMKFICRINYKMKKAQFLKLYFCLS